MGRCVSSLVAVVAIVGCGGEHPIDQWFVTYDELAVELCACPDRLAALGYASAEECIRANSAPVSEAQLSCFRTVYDANEALLAPVVECSEEEVGALTRCLSANTCEAVDDGACGEELATWLGAGPCHTPGEIQEEWDACASR